VNVGTTPQGAQLLNNQIYVALYGEGAIARVEDYLGLFPKITLFPVEGKPLDLRHGLGSETIFFVTRYDQDSVIAVDTENGQLLQDWIVGSGPSYFSEVIDSEGTAYLPSQFANILSAFNINRGTIERSYRTGASPRTVDVGRLGRTAYVTNTAEDSISVVDLFSGLDQRIWLPTGSSPQGVKILPGDSTLLVSAPGMDAVLFVNLTSGFSQQVTLNVGPEPMGVALSEDGSLAFVTNYGGDSLSVIDTATRAVIQLEPTQRGPNSVRVFGDTVLVSNEEANSISVFQIVQS